MKLTIVTAEEVKNNEAGSYNIREWKKKVARYEELNASFYKSDKRDYNEDTFYAVYMSTDGIRFMKEVSFISCLTSAPLQLSAIEIDGTVKDTNLTFPKTEAGRKLMKEISTIYGNYIFA